MTKTEAIVLMTQGKKVRHRFFSPKEWIKLIRAWTIETEEGYKVDWNTFWSDRQGAIWEVDWDEVNE